MITVGALAKTYGQLPSYVRRNATTFDIMVMDAAMTWEDYQQNKASGRLQKPPELSQEELLKILQETRSE